MSIAEQLSLPVTQNDKATGRWAGKRFTNLETWKNVAGYAATLLAILVAMTITLRLWRADLRAPFSYKGDTLFYQMVIQNILESGWHLDGPRIGAPVGQDMRDFPLPEILHLGILKGMGYVIHDSGLLLNLFVLLCFPLTALSAYFVFRQFRLGRMISLTGAVLYTCLPYHYMRLMCHQFLAAYYLLPLMIWLLVRIHLGRHPLVQTDLGGKPCWRFWNADAAGTALICVLTGLAGVYYAFFSCFFLLTVGVRAGLRERRWTPLLVSSLLIAIISGVLGAALLPNLIHEARHGKNLGVAARWPVEADLYGLSISEMLAPVEGHPISAFQAVRARFTAPPRSLTGEFWSAPLGLTASLGFLYLLARFLWRPRDRTERIADALAYMTVVAVLLGTVGGLGSCFNLYVTPAIRCYGRLSVFIAFFGLAGLLLLIQTAINRLDRNVWTRAIRYVGLMALMMLGLMDQKSPPSAFVNALYAESKREYASDEDFGRRMESLLPPGAVVYQMPYFAFPEAGFVQKLGDYELFRPYLHTKTLRFSYGAMKNRATSEWLSQMAEKPTSEALEALAFAGFRGVYLDRAGFTDSGEATEAQLTELLGAKPITSLNGRQVCFDMTAYVNGLRARYSDTEWKAKSEEGSHPPPLER